LCLIVGRFAFQSFDCLKGDGILKGEETSKTKDWWDKFGILAQAVGPVVAALLVLIIGFQIKDSVDLGLRERQLEISSAQGMHNLIAELQRDGLTRDKADAAAIALTAFGRSSLAPLINELNIGSTHAKLAAEKALFMIGVSHPRATCEILERTLNNHNQQFSWSAHRSIIRLLGQVDCRDAVESLEKYRALVQDSSQEGREAYGQVVAGDSTPTVENINALQKEIKSALDLLNR
jgi:hypothetical protein